MATLLNYVFNGGIQGRFFVKSEPAQSNPLRIYEIIGYAGLSNSIPDSIYVDICLYEPSKNRVSRDNELLVNLLDDLEATPKQLKRIPAELKSTARTLPAKDRYSPD